VTPQILPGKLHLKFREHIQSAVALPAGVTNGGLLRISTGFVCVVRNCTWCYPHHLGLAQQAPTNPVRSYLYAVFLDHNLNIQRTVMLSIDEIPDGHLQKEVAFEDARLFSWRGRTMVLLSRSYRRGRGRVYDQYLGQLDLEDYRIRRVPLLYDVRAPQKNWNPLMAYGALYFDYMLQPRTILHYEDGRAWHRWPSSRLKLPHKMRGDFARGSAPAVKVPNGHLLASYHTCCPRPGERPDREYFTLFAYMMPTPPFDIVAVTPELKLLSDGPDQQVQFLMGMVPRLDTVLLSYGVADWDNYLAEVSLEEIDRRMVWL